MRRAGEMTPSRRLGIVLLDGPSRKEAFGCFRPDDAEGLAPTQRGFFAHPATWSVPTAYAVARGATAEATLAAAPQATAGLSEAVRRLDGSADLIISDCGFFWGVAQGTLLWAQTPLLLSGIDLLGLAATVTSQPIGVLSYSRERALAMLSKHPLLDRLRVIGFSAEPAWRPLAPESCDRPDWRATALDRAALGDDLMRILRAELANGELTGVGSLVVECTVIPQFRHLLTEITALPIFDIGTMAEALVAGTLPWPGASSSSEGRAKVAAG
jgi:hypothetical protein